jgi:hypothetical protein
MSCQNEAHQRQNFFSGQYLLPDRLQGRLLTSWSGDYPAVLSYAPS